jgi:hypothetical protein
VGRSKDPRGPYIDQSGKNLVDGGGTVIYGSNAETYAPGGQGVIRVDDTDILYYHYRESTPTNLTFIHQKQRLTKWKTENKSVSLAFSVSPVLISYGTLVERAK